MYELRPPSAMPREEFGRLLQIGREAETLRVRDRLDALALAGQAVRIVLPEIETRVLMMLDLESRLRIVNLWTREYA